MALTILALVVGLGLGLAAGGRLGRLGRRPVRRPALLVAGIAAQLLAALLGGRPALALLLCAYGLLLAFALANLSLTGMGLVVLGLGLNALVIAADGGMPVTGAAAVAAGVATQAQVHRLAHPGPDLRPVSSGRHHLARSSDHLLVLSDALPLRPLGEVVSFGDLVLAVGVIDVAARLVRPRRPVHARRRWVRGGAHLAGPSRGGRRRGGSSVREWQPSVR